MTGKLSYKISEDGKQENEFLREIEVAISSPAFNLSFETTVLAYDIPEENREAFFKNLIIRSIEQAFSNVKLNRG